MASSAAIAKVSPVHQRLADWLLADGGGKGWNKRAAEAFGYTQAWLSVVYHSDAFQDYFKARSIEHSSAVSAGIADKLNGLAGQGLDLLANKLETAGDTLTVNQLIDVTDLALRRAGFSDKPSGPQVQNNLVISMDDIKAAQQAMREPRKLEVLPPEKEEKE